MVKPEELRLSIYQGGIEASLRRVVWRHLLNIFPAGLSGLGHDHMVVVISSTYHNSSCDLNSSPWQCLFDISLSDEDRLCDLRHRSKMFGTHGNRHYRRYWQTS
jgi:hypothetical protein